MTMVGYICVDHKNEPMRTHQGKYSNPTPKVYVRLTDAKRERTVRNKVAKWEKFNIYEAHLGPKVEV